MTIQLDRAICAPSQPLVREGTASHVKPTYSMTGWSVMVNRDASMRTHADDGMDALNRLDEIWLQNDDIRIAICACNDQLDNKERCAKVGAVILLVAIVIALGTLFFHVASI